MLTQLESWHTEDLRVIYRHFPLVSIHDKASLAGQASEAAGVQGFFWDMYDLLFERHSDWKTLTPEEFINWVIAAAGELQLDMDKFEEDMLTGRYAGTMLEAFEQGVSAGLPGTPFAFLNGKQFPVPLNLINLEASIRLELLTDRQYESYPPMMEFDPQSLYLANVHLEIGQIVIQLYPSSAPIAVNSFIFLVEEAWFNHTRFHRVQPGIMVESGDPTGTGFGGPGYIFENEIDSSLNFDKAGMVALSSSGPNTNGSMFFITLAPIPELNGSRTIFGRVLEGLELLQGLKERNGIDDLLTPAEVVIKSVEIEIR